jgi:hypothetical protein
MLDHTHPLTVTDRYVHSLRLVSLVSIRSGGGGDQLDLLSVAEDQESPNSPASPNSPNPLRRLTIVAGSDTDRDALLAGFRLLLVKVRDPYVKVCRTGHHSPPSRARS